MKAGILFKNVFRHYINANLTKVSAIYQIIGHLSQGWFRKKLFKKRVILQLWLKAFQPLISSQLMQRLHKSMPASARRGGDSAD